MPQRSMITDYFNTFFICATILAITLPSQITTKPRHTKFSFSAAESAHNTNADDGVTAYRFIDSNNGTTCILLKTDAVVEVNFMLHNLQEQADSFIPERALVDGNCKNEDSSFMSISWTGYNLVLNFEKTLGGERWYIKTVELTVSPDLPQFRRIQTHGKPIKLYHRETLIRTPIGNSYSCQEVDIELETDEEDHSAPGLRGSLLLRQLQLQPFMYKEDFGAPYECKSQEAFRDETSGASKCLFSLNHNTCYLLPLIIIFSFQMKLPIVIYNLSISTYNKLKLCYAASDHGV